MTTSIAVTSDGAAVIVPTDELGDMQEVARFDVYRDAVREYDWITVSRRRHGVDRLEIALDSGYPTGIQQSHDDDDEPSQIPLHPLYARMDSPCRAGAARLPEVQVAVLES